ncbi:MAG: hypothetical protein IJ860_09680 [Eubacterium sp.]|nr:hypothetical protein [Eubacterium sp.]
MNALNLFTLTRTSTRQDAFSRLLQALSGRSDRKTVSEHEAASLCALVNRLGTCFECRPAYQNWVSLLDGFWFSYSIAHISKEFDLLKFSADASSVLNIELKSEAVPEDRIRRQLEQNRYYLSNVSKSIYSFTYVMETDTLYQLNEKRYLREAAVDELAEVLTKNRFQTFIGEGLDRYFRSSDYLISPISVPDRFLQGRYFLTNQQWEFRRRILNLIPGTEHTAADAPSETPVVAVTGSAGTGKTLLLFDLALVLSRKRKVLFIHGGTLQEGHHTINARLRNVTILSGTEFGATDVRGIQLTAPDPALSDPCARQIHPASPDPCARQIHPASPDPCARQIDPAASEAPVLPAQFEPAQYAYILVDEANRLPAGFLSVLLSDACKDHVPCILSYDPYSIRALFSPMEDAEQVIRSFQTNTFAFSGNIRINRPVFAFMRNLFNLKDRTVHADYSCIDVLCAENQKEEQLISDYYAAQGFQQISPASGLMPEKDLVAQEYDHVLITLDDTFYYDESMHLCRSGEAGTEEDNNSALAVLYEALTRTRGRLAVLITGNDALFAQVLQIRVP